MKDDYGGGQSSRDGSVQGPRSQAPFPPVQRDNAATRAKGQGAILIEPEGILSSLKLTEVYSVLSDWLGISVTKACISVPNFPVSG